MTAIEGYAWALAEKRFPEEVDDRAGLQGYLRDGAVWGIEHLAERLLSDEAVEAAARELQRIYGFSGFPDIAKQLTRAALTAALSAITKEQS